MQAREPTGTHSVVVRPATGADASTVAALAERTFRDAFGDQNPPDEMDWHCRKHFGEAIQAREIADRDLATLLLEVGGKPAGFAQLCRRDPPDCVTGPTPGEVQRFYLMQEFHGAGFAATLMDACLETLRGNGHRVAWLGVWEENPRAIAFYRRHGFVEVGRKVFMFGEDPQRDLVMARPLP